MENFNASFTYKGTTVEVFIQGDRRGWLRIFPDKKEEVLLTDVAISFDGKVVGSRYKFKSNDFSNPENGPKSQRLVEENGEFENFDNLMNDLALPKIPLTRVLINSLMQQLTGSDNLHCFDFYAAGTFFQPMTFEPSISSPSPQLQQATDPETGEPLLDEDTGEPLMEQVLDGEGQPLFIADGVIDLGPAIDGTPVDYYLRDLSLQPEDNHPAILSAGQYQASGRWENLAPGSYLAYALDENGHFNALYFEL
jgi:hypothetical protein